MKKVMAKIMFALLAITMIAGGAQAATIYKKDGLTYKLKGDIQIQLRQKAGDDEDFGVDYDDLELKNAVSYDLGNDLKAFAELDFGFKKAAEGSQDSINFEEAYVGFGYKTYSILFGNTDNAADEFGVFGGYESVIDEDAFDGQGLTSGEDLIRADIETEFVTVVLSHELKAENDETSTEIFVSGEFSGVELGAAYQVYEEDADVEDVTSWGLSVAYDAKVVWVGADYSMSDQDGDETTEMNLALEVPVSAVTLGAGYSYIDADTADDEVSAYYANVTYKFPTQKNVKVFAEVQDSDEDDVDPGFLVGMQLKF